MTNRSGRLQPPPAGRPLLPRAALGASALGALALLGACGGFESIDQRVDRLVRERAALVAGSPDNPSPPTISRGVNDFADVPNLNDPNARRTEPPSNNPPASELSFTPADEDRDVARRLADYQAVPENATPLSLGEVFRTAQLSARELLSAEEEYLVAAINVLIERHLWDPQLAASVTAQVQSQYSNASTVNTTALSVVNQVSATQRLPFGGTVGATYLYTLSEQLRNTVSDRFTSSNQLVLSATVPLLRGAGDVAREDLIQAERELVYAARAFEDFRRRFLVSLAKDYFALQQQQSQIVNQENALKSLRALETRTQALVDAGRVAEFQKNIAASDVLRATSTLASLREQYVLAVDRFKVRLGLSVDRAITISPDALIVAEPEVTPERAAQLALNYRLDLQTARDRVEDARRAVRNADNNTLPDLNAFANAQLTNDPTKRGSDLINVNPSATTYTGGISLGIPLDRVNENYARRIAAIRAAQSQRGYERQRDDIVVEARARVREIDRARFSLKLQEQAVYINQRRRQEQELKADEITAQQSVETANALRDAEDARDRALTDLRNSVLDYLLTTAQLRVDRDGSLMPLPGMTAPKPVQPVQPGDAPQSPAVPAVPAVPASPPAAPTP
jgi:outer membrane protein TolC